MFPLNEFGRISLGMMCLALCKHMQICLPLSMQRLLNWHVICVVCDETCCRGSASFPLPLRLQLHFGLFLTEILFPFSNFGPGSFQANTKPHFIYYKTVKQMWLHLGALTSLGYLAKQTQTLLWSQNVLRTGL
jgi:hypothetical protein